MIIQKMDSKAPSSTGAATRRGSTNGFFGVLAAAGKMKNRENQLQVMGRLMDGTQAAAQASRLTGFNAQERIEAARLLNSMESWQEVAVERISDAIVNGENGKHRIKKLEFRRNDVLWREGDEISRPGIYYVLHGTCRMTRKVQVAPSSNASENSETKVSQQNTQWGLLSFASRPSPSSSEKLV